MNRPSPLTLAIAAIGGAVVAGAPAAALAQAWPAGAITATASMPPQARTLVMARSEPTQARTFRVARAEPVDQPVLKLRSAPSEPDEIPDVDLRPKDEWADDQGLRVSATRVAFKRRF